MERKGDGFMISYCGLDCTQCEAYKFTQQNDTDALAELARRWGEHDDTTYAPDDLVCDGCNSDRLNVYCGRCGVRACGLSRGLENCARCQDYPCEKLRLEWESWHDADWTLAKANLDKLR